MPHNVQYQPTHSVYNYTWHMKTLPMQLQNSATVKSTIKSQLNLITSLKTPPSMSSILMLPQSGLVSAIPPQNIASKTGLAVTRNIL